jgi:hypothetical protein
MGKTFTSRARKVMVACLLLATTGCVEDGVTWLPDSSGFIFTNKDGTQVVHFDVKRRAQRIVTPFTGKTKWPGLSADGKRLAVADCIRTSTKGSSKYSLTITIYSLEGEQLKHSKPFTFTSEGTSETKEESFLDWSGPAGKILVCSGFGFGIYDTVQDKFIRCDAVPYPIAGTPVIPSKKGFLALSELKGIVYYDWDGWETSFEGLEDLEKIRQVMTASQSIVWKDENTVVWEGTKTTLTLDMLKKTATITDVVRPSLPSSDKLLWRSAIGEKSELCLYHAAGDIRQHRLEIQIPSERKRREVFATGEYEFATGEYDLIRLDFFPSPDGSLMAISLEDTILVVDAMGNIVAKVSRP